MLLGTRACRKLREDCRANRNYSETGLEEINRDLLEADFWPTYVFSDHSRYGYDVWLCPLCNTLRKGLEAMTNRSLVVFVHGIESNSEKCWGELQDLMKKDPAIT